MARTHTLHSLTLVLALVFLAALLGCASRTTPAPADGDDNFGAPAAPHRALGFRMTREQGLRANRNHARVLPPQANTALARLGLQQPSTPHLATRPVSTIIPQSGNADKQYTGPGDWGWITKSGDVTDNTPALALNPSGAQFPADLSYVIYRVDDVSPAPRTVNLVCDSANGNIGVAAYDWGYGSTGRWVPVFYGPPILQDNTSAALDDFPGAQWTNAGGDFAFVVFSLYPDDASVLSWELSDVTSNDPPFALLTASPGSGHAPLATTLDASASHDDDGSITGFRFDPLGDGNWQDNGTDPTLNYSYDTPGAYQAQVEVTDNGGLSTVVSTWVVASNAGYDEVEPNNSHGAANNLPAIPFGPFFGNVGAGPGGYDGSIEDVFKFNASIGDEVQFVINYSSDGAPDMVAWLEDSFDQTIAYDSEENPLKIVHKFTGGEIGPFYLRLRCVGGKSDYMITSDNVVYEEIEDDDSPAGAQRLDNLTDFHALVDFDGNVGSGGPEDGDNDDWYYFGTGGAPNYHLHYTLTYDPAANVAVQLSDFDGNVLATSSGGGGLEQIEYDFQPADTEPFFLEITNPGDDSDYSQNATLSITNPGFFEQEDNDWFDTANPLPPVPFTDVTGNVGSGGNYDGDLDDWFKFDAGTGDKFEFTITPSATSPILQAFLWDSSTPSRIVGGAETDMGTGVVTVHALIRSQDQAPFFLQVENTAGAVDYSIDGVVDGFDEVETNDTHATATALPLGSFQFFSGNLGTGGGAEYDGGPVDMFSFNAAQGETPQFTVFYDEGTGLLDGIMKDSADAVLGYGTNNMDGTFTFTATHAIGPGDAAPFYLELTSASLYFDYWITRNF